MGEFGIGQSVPREEDPYLVRGNGRYVDDVSAVNQTRAHVLRSQYSHAKIVAIDVKRARQSPGVLHILTGNDPAVLALGLQAPKQPRKRRDGSPQFVSPQPLLARDRVRYIGQPVAMVIAETLNEAKDAAELIEVEYEDLPSATTLEEAIAPGAPAGVGRVPRQHRVLPRGRQQGRDRRSLRQGRPRHQTPYADQPPHHGVDGAARLPRRIRSRATSATRSAARCRDRIRCGALWRRTSSRFRSSRIRVISDNVGGGFGMKGGVYPEYQLAMLAAKLTGRPVKWIADRSESFLADEHCRDNITEAELALDKNGKFLAIRVKNYCNIGAYNASDRAGGPPTNNIGVLAGTYTFPAGHVEVNGTFTNTMLTGPYRGAGRPEAAYVLETLVDLAARKLGIDPAELRRRNMIPKEAMPFKTALVYTYDCGDFGKNLEDCLVHGGLQRLRGAPAGIRPSTASCAGSASPAPSKPRTPASSSIRSCASTSPARSPSRWARTITARVTAPRSGRSSPTSSASRPTACASSSATPTRSRSAPAPSARARWPAAAPALLDRRREDRSPRARSSRRTRSKPPSTTSCSRTASSRSPAPTRPSTSPKSPSARSTCKALPPGMEAGMFESGTYDGGQRTYPNGCHIVEVEIDEATGAVEIVRYHAVDDVGHMINPMLVEGQLHGGIAMGVGQALIENIVYQGGQIVTGSFMDYGMPRADNFCDFVAGENEVPTKTNPLGVKGAGESGTVGALPAVMNAVNDALARIGAPYVQMPATPEKVWRAIEAARAKVDYRSMPSIRYLARVRGRPSNADGASGEGERRQARIVASHPSTPRSATHLRMTDQGSRRRVATPPPPGPSSRCCAGSRSACRST